MSVVLLAIVLAGTLLLIPLGLPGTWAIVVVAIAYKFAVPGGAAIGMATLAGVGAMAALADVLDFTLAARFARKYGGTRGSAWGAVIGGLVGACVGVPVPVIGPLVGALAGTFAGALIGEFESGASHARATRVAWGALVGRVAASAMRVAIGVVMAVWVVLAAAT
jgi:uncharacterized protein YqgC (DUF456 family)